MNNFNAYHNIAVRGKSLSPWSLDAPCFIPSLYSVWSRMVPCEALPWKLIPAVNEYKYFLFLWLLTFCVLDGLVQDGKVKRTSCDYFPVYAAFVGDITELVRE